MTRTPGTIDAKDQARIAAEEVCRQYAIQIKYNAGVSDASKIDLGVPPVNPARDPRPCPLSPPVLSVIAATMLAQTLRYSDSLTPDSGRTWNYT